MNTEQEDTKQLLQLLSDTARDFAQHVASFSDDTMNEAPVPGSWTAAQVSEHVTLSNSDIADQLSKPGKICERAADAGVERIRSIFLNFDKKLNAPEFIVPSAIPRTRKEVMEQLQHSIDKLMTVARREDPFQLVQHRIFGELTRLETIHFVIYHTQRHIHQLEKIQAIIEKNQQA